MNDKWYRNTLDELHLPHTLSKENLYCILSDAIIAFLDKRLPLPQLLEILDIMQKMETLQTEPDFSVIVADFISLAQKDDAVTSQRNKIIALLEKTLNLMTSPVK